jgi:hypothetical protein
MLGTGRKALFSVRVEDFKEAGNVFHYVTIGVLQALLVSIIQAFIESVSQLSFDDWRLILFFIAALIAENYAICNK